VQALDVPTLRPARQQGQEFVAVGLPVRGKFIKGVADFEFLPLPFLRRPFGLFRFSRPLQGLVRGGFLKPLFRSQVGFRFRAFGFDGFGLAPALFGHAASGLGQFQFFAFVKPNHGVAEDEFFGNAAWHDRFC